jgi:hypothetical protein
MKYLISAVKYLLTLGVISIVYLVFLMVGRFSLGNAGDTFLESWILVPLLGCIVSIFATMFFIGVGAVFQRIHESIWDLWDI